MFFKDNLFLYNINIIHDRKGIGEYKKKKNEYWEGGNGRVFMIYSKKCRMTFNILNKKESVDLKISIALNKGPEWPLSV